MAESLELGKLPEENGMTQVKIGRGGVKPGLDGERLAGTELLSQLLFGDEL